MYTTYVYSPVMSNTQKKLSSWIPLILILLTGVSLGIISCNENVVKTNDEQVTPEVTKATKVLYVTHEPGKYHDYTSQRSVFKKIADEQKWDLSVLSGTHDEVIEKLASRPNFADGYDVIVYNFCFAKCDNLNVPYNIIQQTKVKGIPAMLIHCSLHSFWPTFKESGPHAVHSPNAHKKAHTTKTLLNKWNTENPDKPFPVWSNFSGIASIHHSRKYAINVKQADPSHPIAKDAPEYTTVEKAELYYNFINAEDSKLSQTILEGTDNQGKDKGKNKGKGKGTHAILWEHPVGNSKVVSFTLGHSNEEWEQNEFRGYIANTVNYLTSDKK